MVGQGAPRIERLRDVPPGGLDALVAESEAAGLALVRRLVADWASGANRFDRPREALFAAWWDGGVIGVCGLNLDPYAAVPGVGRVRHLYVLVAHRRLGVGRRLVEAVVAAARDGFATLRLRTGNPEAARLYEGLGFRRRLDVPECTHVLDLDAARPTPASRGRDA